MPNPELEFENWFDIFMDECKKLDYHGPIDADTFRDDHEKGLSPEEAAASFVNEMNS